MPIDYSTLPLPKAGDRKKRIAAARAKQQEKEDKRNDPDKVLKSAIRHHGLKEHELRDKVRIAEEHHAMLATKLVGLQDLVARMDEAAYRKGIIGDNTARVEAELSALPKMIARAAGEVQAALDAVAQHQAATPGIQAEPSITPAPRRPRASR